MMKQVFFNVSMLNYVNGAKGEAGCNCYLEWVQLEVNGINTLAKIFHTLTKRNSTKKWTTAVREDTLLPCERRLGATFNFSPHF